MRRHVGARVGLGEREGCNGFAGGDARDPHVHHLGAARGQDRMGSETLEREGGLGLRRVAGEALANQAKGERRDILASLEAPGGRARAWRGRRPVLD